ncbi:MAG: hydrogenase expression/formation protein HypE [Alphaproteobacteria bacterium]
MEKHITMAMGSGGRAASKLIDELIRPIFKNKELDKQSDYAEFDFNGRMVMATDSHVVTPLFFKGGDIGSLAVNGSVNDVAVAGAEPLYMSCGLIIEEGLPLADLKRVLQSMKKAADTANIQIVTGDTKVVEKGAADKIFINTTAVGKGFKGYRPPSFEHVEVGDKIIISGHIGEHGATLLSLRNELPFSSDLSSDCAALNGLIKSFYDDNVCWMRDATRGGVSACLNELATQIKKGILLYEEELPLNPHVQSLCDILGLDALNIANEGKVISICKPKAAKDILQKHKAHPLGRNAAIIGEVIADENCFVQMQTPYGGHRIIYWDNAEQLPRIC